MNYKPIRYHCPTCGLCPNDHYCNADNKTYIDIFEDRGEVTPDLMHVHNAWCPVTDTEFIVSCDPNHTLDWLLSAVEVWCKQNDLDPDLVHWTQKQDGNYRWRDTITYGDRIIGTSIEQVVKELTKMKAGQPYGSPLYEDE